MKHCFKDWSQSSKIPSSYIVVSVITGVWPWPFQRSTRCLAEKREEELHFFLKQLLQGNPMVSLPGPEVIKLFSCLTQLSMKFQLLTKTKIQANKEVSCFKSLRCCTYHANKCKNANNCWHFNIYEQDKFRAQLSWVWQKFYYLGACSVLMDSSFWFDITNLGWFILICIWLPGYT